MVDCDVLSELTVEKLKGRAASFEFTIIHFERRLFASPVNLTLKVDFSAVCSRCNRSFQLIFEETDLRFCRCANEFASVEVSYIPLMFQKRLSGAGFKVGFSFTYDSKLS